MYQLELFPRTEFKSLSDFQRLEHSQLSSFELRRLAHHPEFYLPPKINEVIRVQHSDIIDRILGFRLKFTEEMLIAEARGFEPEGTHETWGPKLHQGAQTWVGLDVQTLQTPYSECLRILQLLKVRPYQQIVDLGAAYGRMGVVVGGLYIKNSFIGFEYVKGRVDEGNRIYKELGFTKSILLQQDLADPTFQMPEADVYFIYDYGQVEHIDRTLKQIEVMAYKRPVKVVVRGKFTKQIITERHPWLDLQYVGKLADKFSIYTAYIV